MKYSILFVLLMTLSCGKKGQLDLGLIYDNAATDHDDHRNPVILIPGVLGSRLVDVDSGGIVWGAFGSNAMTPKTEDGARAFALPLSGKGTHFIDIHDRVKSDRVLATMKVMLLGLPVKLGAYANILRSLGAGGYRGENMGLAGADDYGDDHFTCFQFDYDWRRDIAESAAQLDAFILEKRAYVKAEYLKRYGVEKKDVKFDIVAHSMGGLVARYYLRYGKAKLTSLGPDPTPTWAGAASVEKVVLVGTPNAGSLDSMETLLKGRFVPFLSGYAAALTGTFPSAYQLLPRTRHGAFVAAGDHTEKLDIFNPQLWVDMEWGLANPREKKLIMIIAPPGLDWPEARELALAHQAKALSHARAFNKAMDVPAEPPPGLKISLVAGDGKNTAAVMEVDRVKLKVRIIENMPGDGTVLRSSVLMDERLNGTWQPKILSPIKFDNLLLLNADHMGMTKDLTFTNNILFYLLESP